MPGEAARKLALRLRSLRKSQWPGVSVTQAQLAEALESRKPTSVQVISSWERTAAPTAPPEDRIDAIATFFSTPRSIEGGRFRLLRDDELSEKESKAREALRRELIGLREAAMAGDRGVSSAGDRPAETIVGHGPWHFGDDAPVVIVCAELPERIQEELPFAGWPAQDRAQLTRFADLDSLFELHGHIRAVNPDAEVGYRSANRMETDDWAAHLVLLGGVDWNRATKDTMRLTSVPVRQYSDDSDPRRGCFQVVDGDEMESFAPVFEGPETGQVLLQDVGHFLRAPNPLNRARTLTVCNGMYGTGVYGAVRTLTDKVFREQNADYLATTFSGSESFSLLFRVHNANGVPATPDWTAPGTVLHKWSEA